MSITGAEVRDRVRSVCAGDPFNFTASPTPFSFDLAPTGTIDEMFRVEVEGLQVIGGFNYTEDRTDRLDVWVARKYAGNPETAYRRLQVDASSIRAAIIRDGVQVSGEYCVPDGDATFGMQREVGKEYAVLRLALPVNYETTL